MSMQYSYIKKITYVFRTILLVVVLCAIAVSIVWVYEKPLVDKLEGVLLSSYKSHYEDKFRKGRKQLEQNNQKGIELLESFLDSLDGVKKQDRLDPLKRQALKLLVHTLRNKGQSERALKWAEKWVAFDPRDLNAQLQQASIMMVMPGLSEDADNKFKALYQKFPEVKAVADNYANVLLKHENYVDAFLVADNYMNSAERLLKMDWEVFWDTGKSFNAGQKNSVKPVIASVDTLTLTFQLLPETRRVRLDPPPSVPLIISDPKFRRTESDTSSSLNVLKLPVKFHQIVQNGNDLLTSGGKDPYLFWELPASIAESVDGTWVFVAKVNRLQPEVFLRLSEPAVAEIVKRQFLDRGDSASLQKFTLMLERQANLKASLHKRTVELERSNSYIEIFWRNSPEVFSGIQRKRVPFYDEKQSEGFLLDYKFPEATNVTQLRFDFPETTDVKYLLESFEILNDTGLAYRYHVQEMVPTILHDVEKIGNSFRALGNDPYFSVDVPEGFKKITSVIIRGSEL